MNKKTPLIFLVNGFPQSGKDTFCDMCSTKLFTYNYFSKTLSSVDKVKEAAKLLGWNGHKDAKGRKFLSDLKDMSTKNYDGPTQYLREFIQKNGTKYDVIFYMVREPDEIKNLQKEFGAKTILIERDLEEQDNHSNHADQNVKTIDYDFTICNNGTLEDLEQDVNYFCQMLYNKYLPNIFKKENKNGL